jgi:hypothetical protein
MVGLTGEWWAEVRRPGKDEVIAQVVNMAWNGVSRLDPKPRPIQLHDPDPSRRDVDSRHGDQSAAAGHDDPERSGHP